MKSKAAVRRIVEELKVLYPNARCSLEYKKDYELLFAVRLSAQCTDARVNMITPALFQKYPSLEVLLIVERAARVGVEDLQLLHDAADGGFGFHGETSCVSSILPTV